jgi:hypothetical protein
MLEDRPILQRSLIGFGAFSFVFTAAMSGTAFMISGGFGLGGEERARAPAMHDYARVTEAAWNDWTQPAYAAPAAYVTPAAASAPAEQSYEATSARHAVSGELDGESATPDDQRGEADILRDIERELASYQSADAYAESDSADAPQPDADIVAAKERAAAAESYGPY